MRSGKRSAALAVVLLLAVASFAGHTEILAEGLKGSVAAGQYTSPRRLFAVPVPEPRNWAGAPFTIEEKTQAGQSNFDSVAFVAPDLGELLLVSVRRIPQAILSGMEQEEPADVLRDLSMKALSDWRGHLLEEPFVTSEKFLTTQYGQTLLRTYVLPKGSLIQRHEAGAGVAPQRFDTLICVIVARRWDHYIVSIAENDGDQLVQGDQQADELTRRGEEFFAGIAVPDTPPFTEPDALRYAGRDPSLLPRTHIPLFAPINSLAEGLQGTVDDETYTSARGLFTVRLPKPANWAGVPLSLKDNAESNGNNFDAVAFFANDFGEMLIASVRQIPREALALMGAVDIDQKLRSVSYAALQHWRVELFEEPSVVQETFVTVANWRALLRVYEVVEGSLVTKTEPGSGRGPERLDALIAVMVAARDDYYVSAIAEHDFDRIQSGKGHADNLAQRLQAFFADIQVPAAPDFNLLVDSSSRPRLSLRPPDGRNWQNLRRTDDGKALVAVWVPQGQTLDVWTERIHIQVFHKHKIAVPPPETAVKLMRDQIARRCPALGWTVINRQQSSVLFESRIMDCASVPDSISIYRIVEGEQDHFEISYIVRGRALPAARRNAIIRWLSAARLE